MTTGDNRSITARDVTGSVLNTGDNTTITSTATIQTTAPADPVAEVAALRALLAGLKVADPPKLESALTELAAEAAKTAPDKEDAGNALGRIVKAVKTAGELGENGEKIAKTIKALIAWAGPAASAVLGLL